VHTGPGSTRVGRSGHPVESAEGDAGQFLGHVPQPARRRRVSGRPQERDRLRVAASPEQPVGAEELTTADAGAVAAYRLGRAPAAALWANAEFASRFSSSIRADPIIWGATICRLVAA
jgi:hypothetical protein